MLKKAVRQGRSKRRGDADSVRYGEPLSEARTPLADFFSILFDLPLLISFFPIIARKSNPNPIQASSRNRRSNARKKKGVSNCFGIYARGTSA